MLQGRENCRNHGNLVRTKTLCSMCFAVVKMENEIPKWELNPQTAATLLSFESRFQTRVEESNEHLTVAECSVRISINVRTNTLLHGHCRMHSVLRLNIYLLLLYLRTLV